MTLMELDLSKVRRSNGSARGLERQLKASLRKVSLERSVGALSAGRAKYELAYDYVQAKQFGLELNERLEQAALNALRGPVRTYSPKGPWTSCVAVFQSIWLGRTPRRDAQAVQRKLSILPSARWSVGV